MPDYHYPSWLSIHTGCLLHYCGMSIVGIDRLATIRNVIILARSERMNRWFGQFCIDWGKRDGIADIY